MLREKLRIPQELEDNIASSRGLTNMAETERALRAIRKKQTDLIYSQLDLSKTTEKMEEARQDYRT